MATIEQTDLPGVGVRYDLWTAEGQRVGVVHHRSGRRELYVSATDDPDTVTASLNLSDDEAHTLVEMMGVSPVVEGLASAQQAIEGLAIDWLRLPAGSRYADHQMGEARIRTRTGVSVVAIIRDDTPIPSPGPEFLLKADDTLVVVGTPDGITRVSEDLKPV